MEVKIKRRGSNIVSGVMYKRYHEAVSRDQSGICCIANTRQPGKPSPTSSRYARTPLSTKSIDQKAQIWSSAEEFSLYTVNRQEEGIAGKKKRDNNMFGIKNRVDLREQYRRYLRDTGVFCLV